MAPGTCTNCRQRSTNLTKTATGRLLCPRCQAQLLGYSAGLIDSPGDVGEAIAVAGWLQRIKDFRKSRRK